MGTSYSTLLFWGVDLGDLTDPGSYETWAPAWMLDEDGDFDDWDPDEMLAVKLGWDPEAAPYPDHLAEPGYDRPYRERDAWRRDVLQVHPEYLAWSANLDRKSELIKAADYGCSIDRYGHSDGDLALLVKVDASVVSSDIWTCVPLDPATIGGNVSDWIGLLTRYLAALEIPAERAGAPGWFMTGSVG